jgi:hypothetical protein
MTLSAFADKSKPPQERDLEAVLGRTYASWSKLRSAAESLFGPVTYEWGFATKSTGWGLRLKREKRIIFYMIPCTGCFLAAFVLGEKAVRSARESGLPPSVLDAIDAAPRYAEGRGIRFEIRTAQDVRNMEKLVSVKLAN